ncbi:MAG: BLUF domain-containing protein, partial [Pararhodobacter sp.]
YDEGRFLQTIEGPPDALETVWTSILRDPRHTDIEVLNQTLTPTRLYSGWDLKLVAPGPVPVKSKSVSAHPIERLARQVTLVAQLALSGDQDALTRIMEDYDIQKWPADRLISGLFEPVARAMGDAWLSDECTDIDLTIGLGVLRHATRTLHHVELGAAHQFTARTKILVACAPGEPHMLGACLTADAFLDTGWRLELAFPENDAALVEICMAYEPDVVVIAMSDAMPRTGGLGALAETVHACRDACEPRGVIISVCGRMFSDGSVTAGQVGADHAKRSVAGTPARIAELLTNQKASETRKGGTCGPGGSGAH